MPREHVLILGGGIAGMSAAHELIERDFKVTVLEKRHDDIPGGKARSIPVPDTAAQGRLPLPGEHGFRFFPGFYKHIIDTMERTPVNDSNAAENLVAVPLMMMARMGEEPIVSPNGFPKTFKQLKLLLKAIFETDTGLTKAEVDNIIETIWQLITSCKKRRDEAYELSSWEEFTKASDYSETYKSLFVEGLTRTLVAAKADLANTRTNGNILLQMLFSFMKPGEDADRILNGPTNDVWLDSWLTFLCSKGVQYDFDRELVQIQYQDEKVFSVEAKNNEGELFHYKDFDYCLCALPVERAASLFQASPSTFDLDPKLKDLLILKDQVAWMNGIQFFFREDVKIQKAHIIFSSTPWALTAISQAQFWSEIDFDDTYGDGNANGVLSVDVSDWERNGLFHKKPAKECTYGEVIEETWFQLKESLNVDGNVVLDDHNLHSFFIDDSIIFADEFFNKTTFKQNEKMNRPIKFGMKEVIENEEPLLVNYPNSWHLRNGTTTSIANLFLASDYVQSNTNLATMEGANEAARHAVNDIIRKSGSRSRKCKTWKMKEPIWFLYFKWIDHRRFKKGKEWERMKWVWYAPIVSIILWIFGQRNKL